ncbi:MAG TPA: hypothetical protein VGE52_15285 [Pirellulales bacterium]
MRGFSWAMALACLALSATTGCRQPAAAPSTPRPPQTIINPFLGPTTLPPPAMPPSAIDPGAGAGSPYGTGVPSLNTAPAAPVDDANLPGPGGASDLRGSDDGGWKAASAAPAAPTRDLQASLPPLRHGSSIQQAVYEEELPEAGVRSTGLADSAGDRYLRSTRSTDAEDLPPAGSKDVRLATYQEVAPAGQSLNKARNASGWGPALKKDSPGGTPTANGTAAAGAASSPSGTSSTAPRTFLPPLDAEPLPPTSVSSPSPTRPSSPAAGASSAVRLRLP